MNGYRFLFANRTVDAPGNPLMIEGATLNEGFDPDALDRTEPSEWHCPVASVHYPPEVALAFPSELWLNTDERRLAFDFRIDMHGVICSEAFAEAVGDLGSCFRLARLHEVDRTGRSVTDRPMLYAKPLRPRPVVDEIATERAAETVQASYLAIEQAQVRNLVLRDDLAEPFIMPTDLEQCLLVYEELAERISDNRLIGVEMVGQDGVENRYNARNSFITRDGSLVP